MLNQFLTRTHLNVRSRSDQLWSDMALRVRRVQASGDRGELLEKVVLIGLFVSAAIVVGGIVVAKATSAANGIQTK